MRSLITFGWPFWKKTFCVDANMYLNISFHLSTPFSNSILIGHQDWIIIWTQTIMTENNWTSGSDGAIPCCDRVRLSEISMSVGQQWLVSQRFFFPILRSAGRRWTHRPRRRRRRRRRHRRRWPTRSRWIRASRCRRPTGSWATSSVSRRAACWPSATGPSKRPCRPTVWPRPVSTSPARYTANKNKGPHRVSIYGPKFLDDDVGNIRRIFFRQTRRYLVNPIFCPSLWINTRW